MPSTTIFYYARKRFEKILQKQYLFRETIPLKEKTHISFRVYYRLQAKQASLFMCLGLIWNTEFVRQTLLSFSSMEKMFLHVLSLTSTHYSLERWIYWQRTKTKSKEERLKESFSFPWNIDNGNSSLTIETKEKIQDSGEQFMFSLLGVLFGRVLVYTCTYFPLLSHCQEGRGECMNQYKAQTCSLQRNSNYTDLHNVKFKSMMDHICDGSPIRLNLLNHPPLPRLPSFYICKGSCDLTVSLPVSWI